MELFATTAAPRRARLGDAQQAEDLRDMPWFEKSWASQTVPGMPWFEKSWASQTVPGML